MHLTATCVLLILVLPIFEATFYQTNLTDFSKCKVHYSRQERTYKVFYHFDDQKEVVAGDNLLALDFHFSVLSASDAHILLAPSSTLTANDPVYEIVIGAGGNTFSDIRRQQKQSVRASVRYKGILSAVDIRTFWIHISKDGTIEVGKDGEELAFISWKDPDLLPLKVFSFSTWGDVEAKWFFDCPRENTSTNSTEIEPVLTDLELLRKHLLTDYNPYVRPVYDLYKATIVSLELLSHFISLDERNSILNMKGVVKMQWEDEKLKWTPSDYGGIRSLHIFHGEIWQPDLVIMGSVSMDPQDIFSISMMIVSSEGVVDWTPAMNSHTWCDASRLGNWPNDVHTCDIGLTFFKDTENIHLKYDNNSTDIFGNQLESGWDIIKVMAETKYSSDWYSSLNLQVKLRRISSMYATALFAPFLVIAACMISTFWVSPFGNWKMTLVCIQLLLTTILLIGLSFVIPAHPNNVPFLVYLYSAAMLGNVGCTLISVIVINLCRNQQLYDLPHALGKILNFSCVQMVLLLPKKQMDSKYGEMNVLRLSIQETWIRAALAIDRIAFVIYFCLILSAFVTSY